MSFMDHIEGVFFCAGARNHLLLDHFQNLPLYMEIDERVASFKALGLGKSRNKIAVVCTTSGTAVSECLSAMIEAYYSEAPLVLVSADRPLNLRFTGAPQTIDHETITRGHRRDYLDMDLGQFKQLDYSTLKYPAHINVRITTPEEDESVSDLPVFGGFSEFISQVKKPFILVSHETSDLRQLVKKISSYGLPFYAEVASGAKELSSIKTEREVLRLFKEKAFDGVIRIGHTPMSKLWRKLQGVRLPVYSFDSRGLKGLSYGSVEKISTNQLLSQASFWKELPLPWMKGEDKSTLHLEGLCQKYPQSEIALMKRVHDHLPSGAKVFLGNSLVIRYFELVQNKNFQIMANRGTNGIDGQLATAIGWSLSTREDIYCILGDMTLSYDLSSLRNLPANLKCIVMNNSGGRIFERLKLDNRLVMAHSQNFKGISQGLGLSYSNSLTDLDTVDVLELQPDLEETRLFLNEWQL